MEEPTKDGEMFPKTSSTTRYEGQQLESNTESNTDHSESNTCILCDQTLEGNKAKVQLREKGSNSINAASEKRRDSIHTQPGQIVHIECRKLYCNPLEIKKSLTVKQKDEIPSPVLRSTAGVYNFKTHCIFCGQLAKFEGRKRGHEVFPVRTLEFKGNIIKTCDERNDDWAGIVRSRLELVSDLPAADTLYHQSCSVNFRTGKQIPKSLSSGTEKRAKKCGRPVNLVQDSAFHDILQCIKDHEQVTLKELAERMRDICGDLAYTGTHLKTRLIEHFGTSVLFTDINGRNNVITFRDTASSIFESYFQNQHTKDLESEKGEIIKTAAKLLLNDMKEIKASKADYPDSNSMASVQQNFDYVPKSLKSFLREIFSEKSADIKIASIGQAIIQAAMPKTLIPPLQIGLGVQMHHHFASKFLIDTLNKLGFSSSYSEVQRFEVSAAVSQGADMPVLSEGQFCQFVADNVDHNLRTIDGHNTFHGMGIIACLTPGVKLAKIVPRLSASTDDIAAVGKVQVNFYKLESSCVINETFEKLPDFNCTDTTQNIDLLSKCIWPLKHGKPGWSGIMQMVQTGNHPGKSSISFLPMIDMNASDISCIYSTLLFVCKQARQLKTFDQPLYWKALKIVSNELPTSGLKSLVLRLGGFHTIMSYLGAIGRLMEGSGLHELLEIVYAPNTVGHMMTGKAVSRATRAHFLVDEVLNSIMLTKVFPVSLTANGETAPETESQSVPESGGNIDQCQIANDTKPCIDTNTTSRTGSDETLSELSHLFDKLLKGEKAVEDVVEEKVLRTLQDNLEEKMRSMCDYRTSKLWIMYMSMIDILRKFIKAERTGQWELHLQAVKDMLPYLAAAGHNLYVKSAYMYIQNMSKLKLDHPEIFQYFFIGNHVVRRSDRFWAGLSSDLVIEQVLMRSIKTTGGLTRGRGMSEVQRNQWLLPMPACSEYNSAMKEFANISYHTSEQHVESSSARRERDEKDRSKFLSFLEDRDPFVEDHALRNIESGLTADTHVNVNSAAEIGQKVLDTMVNENVLEYSFKRSRQAVTLGSKCTIKVDGEGIPIDPQLLFQRLTAAADILYDNQAEVFKHELCSFPSSLFESSGLLRQADKPALATAIWSLGNCSVQGEFEDSVIYVLDGGSLLQRLPWNYGDSFGDICETYVNHITRKYATSIVVFDGYSNGPSTKDCAHKKRTRGLASTKVQFTRTTPFRSKKDHFLSNTDNKQSFINMLSQVLQERGVRTVHAPDDADVLIVKTAIASAESHDTIVVGEDTDLLVLLCYHADLSANQLYLVPGSSKKIVKKWDIIRTKEILGPVICGLLPVIHVSLH